MKKHRSTDQVLFSHNLPTWATDDLDKKSVGKIHMFSINNGVIGADKSRGVGALYEDRDGAAWQCNIRSRFLQLKLTSASTAHWNR